MAPDLLSIFDVASRLNLHVKTVRNYVREGRLKAVRIGKQYRISRPDLEAFTGHPLPPTRSETARRQRHVEVSSVVQIDAISAEAAARLESSAAAFVHGHDVEGGSLRIDCIYDRHAGRMRMIVVGAPQGASAALKFIGALVEKES
jgi:excisionase family DNA binding protein